MINPLRIENFPIIHDIPIQHLWIPPAFALGGYFLPHILDKIFPLVPDRGPLSQYRNQFALVHHNSIRFSQRKFYQAMHVDIKDNLPLMLFIVSTWVLKTPYKDLQDEKLFFIANVFVGCLATSFIRRVSNSAFLILSKESRNKGFEKTSNLLQNIANFIEPTVL
ncbi:MAG: hypothetical protein H0V82_01685 [Candidatus Protochlamydia sp.]|nr:hypothetical protein [Candidatus Protochlamydia sp.]